jgi:oligopeptide/dipeptide ABC transporter ATP-binding protein
LSVTASASNVAGPSVPEDAVLRVRDLHASFRTRSETVQAVRGVSFDLARSERIGIVGESGSGKSALALSIAGLLEPPGEIERGEIWLADRDLVTLNEREMRAIRGKRIGFVFQDALSGLNPVKTIASQIAESIKTHNPDVGKKDAQQRVVALLAEVGISDAERRANEYPHQFSGGMRQRVMIAMAIANEPDIIIADEPTTALDVTTQAQILRLLERLTSSHGSAVIFITHDLGIVAGFCESVCVMYAGRIVERSTVDQIFTAPVHPYTEALLRAIPRPGVARASGRLMEIGGAPPNLARLPHGCSFEPRCFVGKGNERCLNEVPRSITVHISGRPVLAECHFASDRSRALASEREATL